MSFPTYDEQEKTAKGFKSMSGARFKNVIGAIDGILVWTMKPYRIGQNAMLLSVGRCLFTVVEKISMGLICRPFVITSCVFIG